MLVASQRGPGFPSVASVEKLEHVYNRQQPGCSPHPVLRRNQRNRRHGDSGVCHASKVSPSISSIQDSRTDEGPFMDVDPTGTNDEAKVQEEQEKEQISSLVNNMPFRLQDCRKRLADAAREIERCQASAKVEEEARKSIMMVSGDIHDTFAEEVARWQEENTEIMGNIEEITQSKDIPDPHPVAVDLQEQLYNIESKLEQLNVKKLDAEELAHRLQFDKDDLIAKLKASVAREAALKEEFDRHCQDSQAVKDILKNKLNKRTMMATEKEGSNALLENANVLEKQALRKDLGVSEEQVRALKEQVSQHRRREELLNSQINTLHAQLFTLESSNTSLIERLAAAEQGQAAESDTLQEVQRDKRAIEIAHKEHIQLLSEAKAEILKKKGELNEAAERIMNLENHNREANQDSLALSERLRKTIVAKDNLQKMLEALQDSLAATEQELQTTRQELQTTRQELQTTRRENQRLETEARQRNKQRPENEVDEHDATLEMPINSAEEDELTALAAFVASTRASMPQLLLCAHLDEDDSPSVSLRPTQCQIDEIRGEVRLVPLKVAGKARIIALADIASVRRPPQVASSVDIELAEGCPNPRKLRFTLADDDAAVMLSAGFVVKQRPVPGDSLSTPSRTGTLTPHGEPPKDIKYN